MYRFVTATYGFSDMLAAQLLVEQEVKDRGTTWYTPSLRGCAAAIKNLVFVLGDICSKTWREGFTYWSYIYEENCFWPTCFEQL